MSQNVYGERVLIKAARKANKDNPILPIPENDKWIVTNKIRGMLSAITSDGFIARELGLPTVSAEFVAALACEKRGFGLRRITVVLIRKDVLTDTSTFEENGWEFDSDHHSERFGTLRLLQKMYTKKSDDFITLELCMRA